KHFRAALDPVLLADVNEQVSGDQERFEVGLATVAGEPVAGIIISFVGDTAVYLLGASSQAGREQKAAYLLQWQAIQRARAAGARFYDLGGIDPAENPGVHQFKSRMGGVERRAI